MDITNECVTCAFSIRPLLRKTLPRSRCPVVNSRHQNSTHFVSLDGNKIQNTYYLVSLTVFFFLDLFVSIICTFRHFERTSKGIFHVFFYPYFSSSFQSKQFFAISYFICSISSLWFWLLHRDSFAGRNRTDSSHLGSIFSGRFIASHFQVFYVPSLLVHLNYTFFIRWKKYTFWILSYRFGYYWEVYYSYNCGKSLEFPTVVFELSSERFFWFDNFAIIQTLKKLYFEYWVCV